MNPDIAYWTSNGGTDNRTMRVTPRKFRGWGAEVAVHIPQLLKAQAAGTMPSKFIYHLPYGTRDEKAMAFDEYPALRYSREPELRLLAVEDEFLGANLTMHELFPGMEHWWYLGMFAASKYLTAAYNGQRMSQWANRVNTCLRPLLKLKARGVKVGVICDAMCDKDENSQDARGFRLVQGLIADPGQVGIETRPLKVAAWANQPDIPCFTHGFYWHEMEHHGNAIPSKELVGPQYLIRTVESEAQADLAAGFNVAYQGALSGGVQ